MPVLRQQLAQTGWRKSVFRLNGKDIPKIQNPSRYQATANPA
jgi:hypothetical protein